MRNAKLYSWLHAFMMGIRRLQEVSTWHTYVHTYTCKYVHMCM